MTIKPKHLFAPLVLIGFAVVAYVAIMAARPVVKPTDGAVAAIEGFTLAGAGGATPTAGFLDPDGAIVTLADFSGKAVLVNFWATWCAPCVRELPSLDRLQADLGGEEFEVIAVSIDAGDPQDVSDFLRRHNVEELAAFRDPRLGFALDAGVSSGIPATILFDADGREIGRKLGPAEWNSDSAKSLIQSLALDAE